MSVEAYKTLIQSLSEATLLLDGTGRLIAVNDEGAQLLGAGTPELENRQLQEFLSSDEEKFASYLSLCTRSRQALAGGLSIHGAHGEISLKSKGAVLTPRNGDAPAIVLLQLFHRFKTNAQFRSLKERIDELNEEVRKRQWVEYDLRAQKQWLQVTLTSIGDAVIITDTHARVTFLNPIAEKLTGWDSKSALGRPLTDIFIVADEDTGAPVQNPVAQVIEEERIVNLANNSVLIPREGAPIPVADTAAPIHLNGKLEGVVLVFHDVSLKRNLERQLFERAEKLEGANRRINTFLAMLAHELRNPLAPISNAVQLLKLDPKLANEAHRILERQTRHMTKLVNDLLDVSRITQGKISISKEQTDISSLVKLECKDSQSQFDKQGIELQVYIPGKQVLAMVDATRLTQVVGNLLSNARNYTPSGGRVEVSLRTSDEGICLTINDTGIGIDPERLEDIFEPFTQGDQSLDRQQGGLGLGLSLVKGIVELHGGKVTAESDGEGKGSRFMILLPQQVQEETIEADLAPCSADRKSVLLIEDNPDQAETMRLLLEHLGVAVTVADDGLKGLQMADEVKPDIIICDIGLPALDGFSVARRLRDRYPADAFLLIALTGYGQDDFVEKAREAGFDRHFLKPMSLDQIREVLGPAQPQTMAADAATRH